MSDTIATAATLSAKPNVALPHWVIDGTVTRIENASVDGVAPAGSVWSSVSDMAKWSAMLLAGGKTGSLVLLSPATLEELFKPQTMVTAEAFYPTARLTKPKWTTYGLGWFQQDYRGRAADYPPAASTAWWRFMGCSGTRASASSCWPISITPSCATPSCSTCSTATSAAPPLERTCARSTRASDRVGG